MRIPPLGRSRSGDGERDLKAAKAPGRSVDLRNTVPWHERLLLAALLLVVIGWIALRLLLALFTLWDAPTS